MMLNFLKTSLLIHNSFYGFEIFMVVVARSGLHSRKKPIFRVETFSLYPGTQIEKQRPFDIIYFLDLAGGQKNFQDF